MPDRGWQFSWDELVAVTGGAWTLSPLGQGLPGIRRVVDDSRIVAPGDMFIALRGELADGHAHILPAVQAGAVCLCVEDEVGKTLHDELRDRAVAILRVPSTLAAFHALARRHRLRFDKLLLLAVTGSSGKTSTKEMLAAALETHWPGAVLKTAGNTNNHFGVPRNLLRLNGSHRAAVIELGSNHPGEIAALTAMTAPDVGVVCSIGPAHLEAFGDLVGVAREKGAILAGAKPAAVAVFPLDAPHAGALRAAAGSRRSITCGLDPAADVSAAYNGFRDGAFGVTLNWRQAGQSLSFSWGIGGCQQAANASVAAAAATAVGVPPETIVRGLQASKLPDMRGQFQQLAGTNFLNDAYNANPDSMAAGLRLFAEITAGKAVADILVVLGDMRELGAAARDAHAGMLALAMELFPAAAILVVGEWMHRLAPELGIESYQDAASALPAFRARLHSGAWVYLKASRGIRLETLLAGL